MKIFIETERLILRELMPSDDNGMFELDRDKEVHKYLGDKTVESIEESRLIIENIRQQYINNGVGRWALIEKSTQNFIGWAGLKLVTNTINGYNNFYDLGYRLIKKYWGNGYATEAAKASVEYGFNNLMLNEIFADADQNNLASKKVLEKASLKYIETFDDNGFAVDWYKISRIEWIELHKNSHL